jgi:hypothetical protein
MSSPSSAPRRLRLPAWWPEATVLLLAALTRFWRLGYHSIWFDEAVSLRWAGSDLLWIWQKTMPLVEEKHPPAYFILLHGWRRLLDWFGAGQNDALLRASGAALGVLTVAGLLLLVRRLSGRQVALASGLLVALAPALVWYSQELRMFQPAATALVWTGVALLAAWQCERPLTRLLLWAAMAAALLVALYSYLFAALMAPAAGLTLLLLWWADRRAAGAARRLLEGMAAFLLVALLFLPLARNAWAVNSAENVGSAAFAGLLGSLDRLLRSWTIWRPGWPAWLETALLLTFGLLLLAGLLLPRCAHAQPLGAPWLERAWLALWVLGPVLVGNLMLAGNESVFAEDRYFLFVAPFALWGVARGALALGELAFAGGTGRATAQEAAAHGSSNVLGWLPVSIMALVLLAALPVLWTPARHREQWRAASAWIAMQVENSPGLRDAIITHVDYTRLPAEWYLRRRFSFDDLALFHPFGATLTPERLENDVIPPLQGVEAAGYETLYLLQSHLEGVDDGRLVEGWLAQSYPLYTEAFPAGVKLTAYTLRSRFDELPALAPGAQQPNAELAPGLTLLACEITSPVVHALDPALHPGPGWATLRLWWQRTGEVAPGWRSRVRLVDPVGVWGEPIGRAGSLWERYPAETWETGAVMREDAAVQLNPATPSGPYRLEVRLLDAAGADGPAAVDCGEVRVEGAQ